MPICRSASSPAPLPEHRRVRLSRYIVSRRVPVRAANDNRRPHGATAWRWALALGTAVPALAAVLMLSRLF